MKKTFWKLLCIMCSLIVISGYVGMQQNAYAADELADTDPLAFEEAAGIVYEGHSYALYDIGSTWFEAKEYCEKMGGHLVTITSEEEQKAIEELLEFGAKKQYWMGLSLASGSPQWVTGEPYSYSNWDRGEPNECTRSDGQHEYYVQIYNKANPAVGGSQRFKWNDMYYDNTFPREESNFSRVYCGFICEWGSDDVYYAQIRYNDTTYNLLSQPINILADSTVETAVKINYTDATEDSKIYITQNTANLVEVENNIETTIQPGKIFDAGKDIYILIVDESTGDAFSDLTRLKVVDKRTTGSLFPDSDLEGLNFKLGNEIGFTIPDSVPIFNNTDIHWEFDWIPISFEYDHEDSSKINIVFGTNVVTCDDAETGLEFFSDFDFDEYKKDFKKAASKQGRSLKQLRNDFKMSNAQTMSLFGGKVLGGGTGSPAFDVDIAGYAEAKIIDGTLRFIEGQLCVDFEFSYTYNGQLFIWVVPICYEIGASFGLGWEGDMVNIAAQTFIPEFEAYVTMKLEAKLGAGIGVSKVASVGVNGEGSLNMKLNADRSDDYLKAWVEGSADFCVKVFGKKVASKIFAEGEYLIYETDNPYGLINSDTAALASDRDDVYSFGSGDRVYENESRDYLNMPTEWLGDIPPIRLMSSEYTGKSLELLAENVYTDCAPILRDVDGRKVMVMLWDAADRADIDKTMLVWSVFNEETQTWSQPEPVADDGTADFYPSFKDGWVVWQNQKTTMDDTMTLSAIAALGEIYAAKWNGTGFDTPVAITDNDTMDTLPVVCASANEVTIAWVTNTENDVFGITGSNTIMRSVFNGSWGEAQEVRSDLSAVTGLDIGYTGGAAAIAYSVDADNDLQTTDDWDIYFFSDQSETRLTNDQLLDSNPVFIGDQLYFFSGGNIACYDFESGYMTSVFDTPVPGLTDTFSVSVNDSGCTAIWWCATVDTGTEVFCALKIDDAWSESIQITEAGDQSRYPSGLLEEDGTAYLSFCNSIWQDSNIVQSDLYTLQLIPSYDLSIEDAYLDESTMTVYATIKNNGELPVDTYTISLSDTDLNHQETITSCLKAGASAEVALSYLVPDNMDQRTITFAVACNVEDRDLSNNSCTFTAGKCDLEIAEITVYEKIPTSRAVVTISNIGYSTSGKTTVYLREQSKDGKIIATNAVQDISAGEKVVVTFEYDVTAYEDILWYVTVTSENEESTSVNNSDFFVNTCMLDLSPFVGTLLNCSTSEAAFTVYSSITNNTADEASTNLIIAVYQGSGKLKAIRMLPVTISPYDNTTLGTQFGSYVPSEGDYIKMFCLSNENEWEPIAEAAISSLLAQE